jgi:hypothetical protein
LSVWRLLFKWARTRFDRIDRRQHDTVQAIRIYGDTIMAQIDDLNAATTKLTQAVADLQARVGGIPAAPDLTSATTAVNAAADALNAILPATTPAA